MKKLLLATTAFWTVLLALHSAAQAQSNPATQPTVASPDAPGETIFRSIYKRDNDLLRVTFDTDGHPVGGLSAKELDEKFYKTYSFARVLNFLKQNGYRVVSFAPVPDGTLSGTGSMPRSYWLILEYVKPQP